MALFSILSILYFALAGYSAKGIEEKHSEALFWSKARGD